MNKKDRIFFRKNDTFATLDRYDKMVIIRIESNAKFEKGSNDPSYKISLDNKIYRHLYPQEMLLKLYKRIPYKIPLYTQN